MTSTAPSFVNLEGVNYEQLIEILEDSELTGMQYNDLIGYLQRDLQIGLDGMPVQSAPQPSDGQVLAWKKSKGAWIPDARAYAGLGHFAVMANYSGSIGTGGVTITTQAITIKNPAGANVRWTFGASGFSPAGTNKSNYMLNTDGTGWFSLPNGGMYFNVANQHMWLGTGEFINFMSAGNHNLSFGMFASTGSFTMDFNDSYTFAAYELP